MGRKIPAGHGPRLGPAFALLAAVVVLPTAMRTAPSRPPLEMLYSTKCLGGIKDSLWLNPLDLLHTKCGCAAAAFGTCSKANVYYKTICNDRWKKAHS
jgi:hypothetical protein